MLVHTADIPFVAVLECFLIVLISSPMRAIFVALFNGGRINNVNPRNMYREMSKRVGLIARLQAVHENSIEALLYLVGALLVVFIGTSAETRDQVLLAQLCIIYVVVRVVFHLVYIPGLSFFGNLRTIVFFHGVVVLIHLFTMPIKHMISISSALPQVQ